MSSSNFDATIDLALRPSVKALQLLFFAHVIPLVLLPLAMAQGPGLLVAAGVMLASWIALRRHPVFGYGPRALSRLTWHADGRWTLHPAAGPPLEARLRGDSHVWPALIVLRFAPEGGGVRTRAILGDELPAPLLARLRARLSLPGAADDSPAPPR